MERKILDRNLIIINGKIPVRKIKKKNIEGMIIEAGNGCFTVLRTEGGNPNSKLIYEQTLDFNSRINYFPNNPNEFVKVAHNTSKIFKPTDHGYKERTEKLRKSGLLN